MQDNRRLLLHIGYPKSGSKLIQLTLRKHQVLKNIKGGFFNTPNVDQLNQIILSNLNLKYIFSDESYLSPVLEELSSKNATQQSGAIKIQQYKRNFSAHASKIKHAGIPVNILIIYREPISFIRSMYKESVRTGYYEKSFPSFVTDWEELFYFMLDINKIKDLININYENAQLQLVPFGLMYENEDSWRAKIIEFFEGYIDVFEEGVVNASFSNKATEYLRRQNRILQRSIPRAASRHKANGLDVAGADLENFLKIFPRAFKLWWMVPENAKLFERLCGSLELETRMDDENTNNTLERLSKYIREVNRHFFE